MKPLVGRVNNINLGINNNKYDLSTLGASLTNLIQTLFKSISKKKQKLPDLCKSKWNSS